MGVYNVIGFARYSGYGVFVICADLFRENVLRYEKSNGEENKIVGYTVWCMYDLNFIIDIFFILKISRDERFHSMVLEK